VSFFFMSVWRGIRAIKRPYAEPRPAWTVRPGMCGFWVILWTPIWHEGRGPYVSVGLGLFAVYRGY